MNTINWSDNDDTELLNLYFSNEWFLKEKHQAIALKARQTIDSLNHNLIELAANLEKAEQRLDEEYKAAQQTKTKLIIATKENQELLDTNKVLEETNSSLNTTLDNYDKSVNRLEQQIEKLDKDYNEMKERYDNLVSTLRVLLPEVEGS